MMTNRDSGSYYNRRRFSTVIKAILIVCCVIMLTSCQPLLFRLPEKTLGKYLLRKAGAGSSLEEVNEYIEALGYEDKRPYHKEPYRSHIYPHPEFGDAYLDVYLGDYMGIPWLVSVITYWIFDSDDLLIDVMVDKERDAP